jgi:hypothetical protein
LFFGEFTSVDTSTPSANPVDTVSSGIGGPDFVDLRIQPFVPLAAVALQNGS